MKQYHDLLKNILECGEMRKDRTGIGTLSVFGTQSRYDLSKGFLLVTTKFVSFKSVLSELLWFLEGSTDERRLCEILHGTRDSSKKTIWTANAENQGKALGYAEGQLGPVYGAQWRRWQNYYDETPHGLGYNIIDQIEEVINSIGTDPFSRRHIISAWNVGELGKMALPPCHMMFQFYVSTSGKLSCHMYQRSADVFLGVPYNIASYATLTHIIAQLTGLEVGELIHTTGDAHIYLNHVDQAEELLSREVYDLPTLQLLSEVSDIDDLRMEDFILHDYKYHPAIKAEMAV